MPAFLRDNLPYKLLALAFAVLLHFYVAAQQNPARLLTVPLTLRNQPTDVLVDQDAPHQIMLTLNGPVDELDHVALSDVTASVDLSRARPGKSLSLPVQVKAPGDLQATASPDTVTLSLLPKQTRRLAVAAADPGPALPGYRFLAARIRPPLVTVAGDSDDVASVAHLVARANASGVGTIDDDFDIVALDSQGGEVSGITITPSRAHVTIRMVRAPALKNVLVTANTTGVLPAGSRVDGVNVHPLTVVIAGRPERLAQIKTIDTAPIDLSGLTGDITRTVNCVAPPGVTFSGASAVVVTVHVVPQNAPVSLPAGPPPPGNAAPNAPLTGGVPPTGTSGH